MTADELKIIEDIAEFLFMLSSAWFWVGVLFGVFLSIIYFDIFYKLHKRFLLYCKQRFKHLFKKST